MYTKILDTKLHVMRSWRFRGERDDVQMKIHCWLKERVLVLKNSVDLDSGPIGGRAS